MQDHYVARVSYPVVGAQSANERSRGLPLAGEVMRWLFTGKRMLTYSPSVVAASVKVLGEAADPRCVSHLCDGQLHGWPDRRAQGDARSQRGRLADAAAVARLCRGNRPGDMPAINPGYLSGTPTGAPSSAACAWRGACSPPPPCSASSAKKPCQAPKSRPTTNSSTTRGATAAPAITPAALPAGVGLCDLLPERRCATM